MCLHGIWGIIALRQACVLDMAASTRQCWLPGLLDQECELAPVLGTLAPAARQQEAGALQLVLFCAAPHKQHPTAVA